MKKINLLALIPAVGIITPIVGIMASCNNSNSNVSLDSSTTSEQETTANITTATYCFDVKNYSESTDEVEPEITDTTSQDEVSVQILSYEFKNGKLYVTVSISKTDGTLNDQEEVSFSINFKCLNKETKVQKWANKIERLKVRHNISETESAHIVDTDTQKTIVAGTEAKSEATATFNFAINELETWSGDTPTYDISKLQAYTYQGVLSRMSRIHLADNASIELKHDETGTIADYMQVTVTYDTTLAQVGDSTNFGIAFAYNKDGEEGEDKWIQTIDGFSIKFGEVQEPHLYLSSSRERHYYKTTSNENEHSYNYICLAFDSSKDYTAEDFAISLNKNEKVSLVKDSVRILDFSSLGFKELAFAYEVKDTRPQDFGPDRDMTNVSITIQNNKDKWEQTIKGFTFENYSFKSGNLVSYDKEAMGKVALSVSKATTLTDVFKTITPFEAKDVMLGTVTVGANTYELNIDTFNAFGTSIIVPALDKEAAGTEAQTVTYNFIVHTVQACYAYELTVDTVIGE